MPRPTADEVIRQGIRMRALQRWYFRLRRMKNRGEDVPEEDIRAALSGSQNHEREFDRMTVEYRSPQADLFDDGIQE